MSTPAIKVSINKLSFYVFVVLFRFVLDGAYAFFVSQVFEYDGYVLEFSISTYLASWIVYLCSLVMLSDRLEKVSDYFFLTAVLSVIAPLTSIYGLDSSRSALPVLISVAALLWAYFLTRLTIVSFKGLPIVRGGRTLSLLIAMAFVVFLVIWFLVSGARPNLDLSKVYEFRSANADIAAQGILAYTNNWTFQIFSTYLMCFALYARRYMALLLLLGAQIFFFSISSHKSVLFLPLLVISVWLYFRKSNSLVVLPAAFFFLIALSISAYVVVDDVWMISLVVRRVFFMPASLSFAYFDYFSVNPHTYWSNSFLSGVLKYPYGDVAIPFVIGTYLGSPDMGANNGFVSSGFAHAGTIGVFLYATIVGLMLRFINDISAGLMPVWVAVAISVVPLRSLLISSDLLTVMLTHGFAIAILLMYLSRKRGGSSC